MQCSTNCLMYRDLLRRSVLRFPHEKSSLPYSATAEVQEPTVHCQEEPQVFSGHCDIFGWNEKWWDSLLSCSTAREGYRLCCREWQGG